MPSKQVLIAAGGTGGHLIPAQVLAQQLVMRSQDVRVRFAAAGLAKSRYFDREHYEFADIPASTLSLRKPLRSLRGIFSLLNGFCAARKLLRADPPQVVVGFGSYHTLPVLAAARTLRIPILLHEANAYPGKVVRLFSKKAQLTGLAIPEAAQYLKGRWEWIPTPLRPAYENARLSKEVARQQFGLKPDQPTLLVFGGSQGARSLNRLVALALARCARWQVIHLTGYNDNAEAIVQQYRSRSERFYVAPFEKEMAVAWQAVDLVIMRAGASSIAEALAMGGVPSILVPYPYAADSHQDANAAWMQSLGGGIALRESELSVDKLCQLLNDCSDDRLAEMRAALGNYQKPSKRSLLDCVWEILNP